eukprot:638660-Pleurochrysis_carterae.AAC.1
MSMLVEFQDGDGCDVDRLEMRLGPWKAPRCYQLRAIRNLSAALGWRETGATACRAVASPRRSVRSV